MTKIETVKIVKDNGRTGYAIINKADFDPKVHELFETEGGLAGLSVPELKARLKELDIEIPAGAKKADLIALLSRAEE